MSLLDKAMESKKRARKKHCTHNHEEVLELALAVVAGTIDVGQAAHAMGRTSGSIGSRLAYSLFVAARNGEVLVSRKAEVTP